MPTTANGKLILYGAIGLVVVAIVALLAQNSSSTTSNGSATNDAAAVNAIAASNVAAQNDQAQIELARISSGTSLATAIVQSTQAIQLDQQNNAASLAITQSNNTTALSEADVAAGVANEAAQLQAGTATLVSDNSLKATQAVAGAQQAASQTASGDNLISSIFGSVVKGATSLIPFSSGFFGGGYSGPAMGSASSGSWGASLPTSGAVLA